MRIALILLGLLLIVAPAAADTDVSVTLGVAVEGSADQADPSWYWGDLTNLNGVYYSGSSLTIGGGEDWNARFNTTTGPAYYPYGYYQEPVQRFDRLVTPFAPLVKPFSQSADSYSGGGYRVAIPRGLGGAPELYGNYEYDQYGNPVPVGNGNGYQRPTYHPYGRHHRNRPVVINYSYGYHPYYGYQPVYTAPSYAEYGYVGTGAYPGTGYNQPRPGGPDIQGEAVNVYQGDVYNYYYPEPAAPIAPAVTAQPALRGAVPPEADQPPAAANLAYGMRFYEQARLETPESVVRFKLDQGRLSAGPDNGPAREICATADMTLGAYAAYTSADGVIVLYGDNGRLAAAYPLPDGSWLTEPLPYAVDFDGKTTLGLVGGVPWVVFNTVDGTRYVLSFAGRAWQEIGSATGAE